METAVFVASECCPVGCGFEVILLRARHSADIFAYCEACGCVWSDPRAARIDQGLNEILPPYVLARDVLELPSRADVAAAGFDTSVLRALAVSNSWRAAIEKFNAWMEKEKPV